VFNTLAGPHRSLSNFFSKPATRHISKVMSQVRAVPCVMEERLLSREMTAAAALPASRHQLMIHAALSAQRRTPDSTTDSHT